MCSLVELNKRGDGLFLTNKGTIHDFLTVYDSWFLPYKDKAINIFEVGYQYGGSCELWAKYFTKAQIRSIDTNDCVPLPFCERIRLDIMDVNDLTSSYFENFPVDIAIDDGSHVLAEQIHFIKTVYPVMRKGGLLIIEDVQDISHQYKAFKDVGIPFKVVDNREAQKRYDEVLLLFKK